MIVMGHKVDESLLVGPGPGPGPGPEELLEYCWFFGNTKMSKILTSDPNSHTKSYEEAYESIEKLSVNNNATRKGSNELLGGRRRRRKSIETSSNNSLPVSVEEEEEEEEVEFSMGKLIRQASLNHSHTTPPKKVGETTASLMQQSGKKPEVESPVLEKRSRPQNSMGQLKTQKSLSALQCNDLRLLAFDLNSTGVTSPVLQEKLRKEKSGVRKLTRTQSWAPPVPVKMGGKKSKEDIKSQIKFWARAVASDVNPES